MTNYTEQQISELIRQAGEGVKLSQDDKIRLKTRLMAVMNQSDGRILEWKTQYQSNQRRFAMPLVPLVIALFIAVSGGTAIMADTAKPGDFLYPVDQFIERVQEQITISTEAKAGLYAKFSEERLIELQALQNVNLEQSSEARRERWEQHRQEAIARLAASIERVNTVQAQFEAKLSQTEDAEKRAVFQKIINHLDEVKNRREITMDNLEAAGSGQFMIRTQLRAWEQENSDETIRIREEVRLRFGGEVSVNDSRHRDDDDNRGGETSDAKLPKTPLINEKDTADTLALAAYIKAQTALVRQGMQEYWNRVSPWYPPKDTTPEPEPSWPPRTM